MKESLREYSNFSKLVIPAFTDGSCLNNGQKDTYAGYAVIFPFHKDLNEHGCIPVNTNNRAEMFAIIKACQIFEEFDKDKQHTLKIYTDSKLCVQTFNSWMEKWKNENWQKSTNGAIQNLDFVQIMYDLKMRLGDRIIVKHVFAHTKGKDFKSRWNRKADELARLGALETKENKFFDC
ncbi:Ribonuclease H domain-containing protein [Rozella allomycis CSF55]|uniref:ribonuclease H n=1 Tax=Rozella allomycis (strain CSF55) TaxID=988480 RepID=A0A075APJ0_ROZAC|nr:Ribonuclease H domain-containing protein [Rozella allomycis CSF55]|eukprot:EPZ32034.1 Ribonuclease H domain-containing protein [Rozella allomycis CSF55]